MFYLLSSSASLFGQEGLIKKHRTQEAGLGGSEQDNQAAGYIIRQRRGGDGQPVSWALEVAGTLSPRHPAAVRWRRGHREMSQDPRTPAREASLPGSCQEKWVSMGALLCS